MILASRFHQSHGNAASLCLSRTRVAALLIGMLAVPSIATGQPARSSASGRYEFHDSHFHLTNYIQEGISVRQYLTIMGKHVGRSTLFGIPLQQTWSYRVSGDSAPTYYLETDAGLYYYSFTDAAIATAFKSLSKADQARFDPKYITDTVAPKDAAVYYAVCDKYQPLWQLLTGEAKEGTHKESHERIFDEGRRNARAWEKAHPAGCG